MDACQHSMVFVPLTFDQCQMYRAAGAVLVSNSFEFAMCGLHRTRTDGVNQRFSAATVFNQASNRADLQAMFGGKGL